MQAWEIVTAALGQIRAVGMAGSVVGLDLSAVRALMDLQGCGTREVLELVLAAEQGIRAAGNETTG